MAKPIQPQEEFRDLPFPINGIDIAGPFDQQREGTTPIGLNVRVYEPTTLRGRGGARAGLSHSLPQLPHGAQLVQNINFVVWSTDQALLDSLDTTGSTPDDDLGMDDPSSDGPESSWARGPKASRRSRNPGRIIRFGGSGKRHSKNTTQRLKIKPKSVKIIWATPADITTGTPLSGTQLNAVAHDRDSDATVSGTFVYSPPSGTVLKAGRRQALNTKFTPDNLNIYKPSKALRRINVGGIAFVQQRPAIFTGGATGGELAYSNPVVAGNLLVVVIANLSVLGAYSVVDTLGNVYAEVVNVGDVVTDLSVWYCVSAFSGANTVSVAWGAATNYGAAAVLEYHGADAVAPADAHSINPGDSNNPVKTTIVGVSSPGGLVIGAFSIGNVSSGITIMPNYPFVVRCSSGATGSSGAALIVVDDVNASGPEVVGGTLSINGFDYSAIAASFKHG